MSEKITLQNPNVVKWFLLIHFFIGLVFTCIFVFIPDLFLSFIGWPISVPDDQSALFGYRLLGIAILGLSSSSLLIIKKDEYKDIYVIMVMECIWFAIALIMMLVGHLLLGVPLTALFIDIILIALFLAFLILLWIEHDHYFENVDG